MRIFRLMFLSGFLCAGLLAACGAPSDADLAAQQQQALIATVAAAPPAQNSTVEHPAATSAGLTAQPVATIMPSAAPDASTTVPSAPATAETIATVMPSASAEISTVAAEPTVLLPSSLATATPESAPTIAPSAEPPSPVPPTSAPTAEPTSAPTAEPTAPPIAHNGITELSFSELYSGASVTGPILSEKASSLNGSKIVMVGYMAPPLKPDLDFFVLTKDPMVYCPFCSTAADWPFDIVFVRMADGTVPALTPTQGIRVIGTFQTGTATDPATGFVSQIRIIADSVEVIQ